MMVALLRTSGTMMTLRGKSMKWQSGCCQLPSSFRDMKSRNIHGTILTVIRELYIFQHSGRYTFPPGDLMFPFVDRGKFNVGMHPYGVYFENSNLVRDLNELLAGYEFAFTHEYGYEPCRLLGTFGKHCDPLEWNMSRNRYMVY